MKRLRKTTNVGGLVHFSYAPWPPSTCVSGTSTDTGTCEFRTTRALDWSLQQQKNRNSNESPKFKFQYLLTCCFLLYLWLSWRGTWNPRNQGLIMYHSSFSLAPELLVSPPMLHSPGPPGLSGGLAFELAPTLRWPLSDLDTRLVDFLLVCAWLNFWTNPWLWWLWLIPQLWVRCMNTLDPLPSL